MKLRACLLAGATVLALSAPAAASGDGWYLGLGMGWDTAQLVHLDSPPPIGTFHGAFNDDVLGTASVGYKWDNFRAEFEGGYDEHAFHRTSGVAGPMAGGAQPDHRMEPQRLRRANRGSNLRHGWHRYRHGCH